MLPADMLHSSPICTPFTQGSAMEKIIDNLEALYATDRRVHSEDIDGVRYVYVAGTGSLEDILNNLRVRLVPANLSLAMLNNGAKIHEGIYSTFRDCEDLIIDACLERSPHRIVLAGHSLGAALACFAGYLLVHSYGYSPENLKVLCLGSPRLGNAKWAKHYSTAVPHTWRIETDMDPVTKLPPPWGWRHVGNALRLDERGRRVGNQWSFILHLLYALGCKSVRLRGHGLPDYRVAIAAYLRNPCSTRFV